MKKQPAKRGRGRPAKNDAEKIPVVNITLSRESDAIALRLGSGNRSKGIAVALAAFAENPSG